MRWDVWVVVPLVAFAALTGFARPWQDPAADVDQVPPPLDAPEPPAPEPPKPPLALPDPGPHGLPFVKGDLRRTGDVPHVSVPDRIEVAWQIGDWNREQGASSVVRHDGIYYARSDDGRALAADAAGDTLWRRRVTGTMGTPAGPAVDDGLAFFDAGDGRLYAADVGTGLGRWSAPVGGTIVGSPLVHDGLIHVATVRAERGGIQAITVRGSPQWGAPLDAPPSDIAIDPAARLLVFGDAAGMLQAWDLDRRSRAWAVDVGAPVIGAPALADGAAFVAAGDQILRVDHDGTVVWNRSLGGLAAAGPSVGHAAAQVYAGDVDGVVHALDARDGGERWRVKTGPAVQTPPIPLQGGVLAGSGDALYALSDAGRVVWSIGLDGPVTSVPWVDSDAIVVATGGTPSGPGSIHALRPK